MRSRHYTQEVGLTVSDHRVPVVVAIPILAVVAVVAALLLWKALAFQPPAHAAAEPAAPAKVAHR